VRNIGFDEYSLDTSPGFMSTKHYFRKYLYTPIQEKRVHFLADILERVVTMDIYQPKIRKLAPNIPILLFNDGQDLEKIQIKPIFRKLLTNRHIKPCIIVGIHSNANRNHELGTTQFLESNGYGKDAAAYQDFIIHQLIPYLKDQFGERSPFFMAGFSLGGLSALDLVLNHPDSFAGVGVFSGALWWRDYPFIPSQPNANLIIPRKIQSLKDTPKQKFWFQAGTLEETSDRDNNGVIDVIDDSLRTIQELKKKKVPQQRITYVEIKGGKHDYATWRKAMGGFLVFCGR